MAFNFHQLFHKDLRPDNILIGADPENAEGKIYKIGYPLLMNP
jgi:Ser/Thr protein kinase RdoA (MazF antagonist)